MNTKRIVFIICTLVVGALLLFFSFYSHTLTRTTDLSQESINEIKIHQSIRDADFLKKYGKPLKKDNNEFYNYYHWRGGLETASNKKGTIMRLIISDTNKTLHTKKGIKLGDNKEKVISKYGNHYYKSSEQGADIFGFIDHQNNITLEFWCDGNGKVAEIRLDDAEVK